MRYQHLLISLVGVAGAAVASVDRFAASSRAAALPAPFADSLVSMYEVDGIKVIQRRVPDGEVVSLRVYLLGGSRQIDATNAGVERVMLMASEYGTKNYPGRTVRAAQAKTGSEVEVSGGADWTTMSFYGLAAEFDSTMAVVGDRIANPTLDSASVAMARNRALVSVRLQSESPADAARQLAESLAFAGHPYANPTSGTLQSLGALTHGSVADFHKTVTKSRLLVVVAGNVSRSQVELGVQRTLGSLPAGNFAWSLANRWAPSAPAVAARKQQVPSAYIAGVFSGPPMSNRDAAALQLGLSILSGGIYGPMRDSGITYAAGVDMMPRGASGGVITVTTPHPDRAMRIINNMIEGLSKAYFPQGFLSGAFTEYDRDYQARLETTRGQVDLFADAYLNRGNLRYHEDFGRELRQLTLEDMQRALRAYVKNIQWGYIGDTLMMPRAMMTRF